MKGNAWLAGYIVVTALLVGGAGFFFFTGYGSYNENFQGWDNLSSKIARLEKEVPYPNTENEETLRGVVESYNQDVNALYESLARYQKPLDESISDSDFTTQLLSGKVAEFKKFAKDNGTAIRNEDQFYLAMGAYESTFPKPAIVPLLDYQLGAIDHLLRVLVEAGAEQLNFVNREDLPGESGEIAEGAEAGIVAGKVVQKYPINIQFSANHGAFQEFVNQLANDKDYFFILRLLRVENSSPDGPALGGGDDDAGPKFVNAAGQEPPADLDSEIRSTSVDFADMSAKFREKGYEMKSADARVLFGREQVNVFAVIDLVRFLPPDEVEVAGGAAEEKGPKNRKRP